MVILRIVISTVSLMNWDLCAYMLFREDLLSVFLAHDDGERQVKVQNDHYSRLKLKRVSLLSFSVKIFEP